MIAVQFPEPKFRMKNERGQRFIFDAIRKSWIVLTEEEWVRQNFVQYLVQVLSIPVELIALEKEMQLNGLKKRFDILVYDASFKPWMMVECKQPQVAIDESTLQQVLRYNMSIPVAYMVLTNGTVTVAWQKTGGEMKLLDVLPSWHNKE
jgi:hypothetical protein